MIEGEEVPDGGRRFTYAEVDRARTVFEWGAAPPVRAAAGETPQPRRASCAQGGEGGGCTTR